MNETSKAALRRSRDPAFVQRYFSGAGIDIGAKADSLATHQRAFPRIASVEPWGKARGELQKMPGLDDASFDFVHASHCLADQDKPYETLSRWLDLLKPGGFAVVTVPDEDLYGKGEWPNRFNRNHKSSFTMCKPAQALPRSVEVLDLVRSMTHVAECERVLLVRDHYDDERANVDQTAHGVAECAIEIVLRKRDVLTASQMMDLAGRARSVDECIAMCETMVRTYPYRFDVCHRALMLAVRWDVPEKGNAWLQQAVERLPADHLPKLYRALHAISCGKLQLGFAMRENLMSKFGWQRRTTTQPPQNIPAWKGQPLQGKSIAIWSEFGLGDEIFFLRFARIFREHCAASRVVVVCQAPLVELYEASGEADQIVAVADAANLSDVDYWVYPHAIPAWLPLDLEALPDTVPYLRAPADAVSRLPDVGSGKLKVGVVFKGNPTHENDRQRSLASLSVLDELFGLEGMEFFSLQKGAGADEAAHYAQTRDNFHDVGAHLNSMAETASAIAALDVVVTVDTSVAHVAGALGKPVWLLLPAYGDWRWHYTREDSPWYPTMRLFRRRFNCDWTEVVARVAGHLMSLQAQMAESREGD